MFPHVRLDRAGRAVEFDGHITPMMHFENQPVMWLEVLVTTSETKPHEALVVSEALGEHIHAALLLAGAEPGAPGLVWVDRVGQTQRKTPTGAAVRVRFNFEDPQTGEARSVDPREWVVDAASGARMTGGRFVFAGSAVRQLGGERVYSADLDGTIVGLVTFGTELVAFGEALSHEESIDEPVWQADMSRVPPNRHPVVVRLEVE